MKTAPNFIEDEINWFTRLLDARIRLYFEQECEFGSIYEIMPPPVKPGCSEYAVLLDEYELTFNERLIMILALIPHLRPQALDTLFISNVNTGRAYTEFGGWKGNVHGGFLPTGETAAFILTGTDINKRIEMMRYFDETHTFAVHGLLSLEDRTDQEPVLSGRLSISRDIVNRCTGRSYQRPDFSASFPAKRINSALEWDELVLADEVMDEVNNINAWVKHQSTIMHDWALERIIKPGYRALFYGPPGTGKSLTVALLGAATGLDVYRIDLSQITSKYIGETEKNLSNVFRQAERKKWILFFDEADALFGKRTQTSSANDRYANQEVAYLLQRIEDFPGVVILATNLKANIDEAFARRFQSLVYFPMPDVDERTRLWRTALNGKCKLNEDVCVVKLAERYELSGGGISNVIRYGALSALRRNSDVICLSDLTTGISKELKKEGKTL